MGGALPPNFGPLIVSLLMLMALYLLAITPTIASAASPASCVPPPTTAPLASLFSAPLAPTAPSSPLPPYNAPWAPTLLLRAPHPMPYAFPSAPQVPSVPLALHPPTYVLLASLVQRLAWAMRPAAGPAAQHRDMAARLGQCPPPMPHCARRDTIVRVAAPRPQCPA